MITRVWKMPDAITLPVGKEAPGPVETSVPALERMRREMDRLFHEFGRALFGSPIGWNMPEVKAFWRTVGRGIAPVVDFVALAGESERLALKDEARDGAASIGQDAIGARAPVDNLDGVRGRIPLPECRLACGERLHRLRGERARQGRRGKMSTSASHDCRDCSGDWQSGIAVSMLSKIKLRPIFVA